MAAAGFYCELAPGVGEEDGSVRLSGDVADALQALDGAARGDVCDAEAASKVDRPSFAGLRDECRDQFHVVLRRLLGVLLAGAASRGSGRGAR